MTSYLIRRSLLACLTLGLITFVIYGLIRSMPGDPVAVIAGNEDPSKKIKPEDLERMRAAYGLDKPWYLAYGTWMGNVLQGIWVGRSRGSNR